MIAKGRSAAETWQLSYSMITLIRLGPAGAVAEWTMVTSQVLGLSLIASFRSEFNGIVRRKIGGK